MTEPPASPLPACGERASPSDLTGAAVKVMKIATGEEPALSKKATLRDRT